MTERKKNICIGDRNVGPGEPTYLIAEVGLAHEGSLGTAFSFVNAAVEAGVDAVKFQTHIADAEGTTREAFRVNVFPQDKTRQDYWRRTAFTADQWRSLADHCRQRGVAFLSSPFSEEAADLLLGCGVPAWKVASGEVSNVPLLEHLAATRLPVLVSSGMSDWQELDAAIRLLTEAASPVAVLQCTSAYPCPPESWGLNLIGELKARYQCPVGLSDHSGTPTPGLAAAALGADILEFHLTLGRGMFGPDVSSSLTVEQTQALVLAVRSLDAALSAPVDKNVAAGEKDELRALFTKSVVAATDIGPGTVLLREHLAFKKPGDGIPAGEYRRFIGRRTKTPLAQDQQLHPDALEKA